MIGGVPSTKLITNGQIYATIWESIYMQLLQLMRNMRTVYGTSNSGTVVPWLLDALNDHPI